jgi:hypothetical protein
MTKANEPAFPCKGKIAVTETHIDPFGDKAKEQTVIRDCVMPGLTKREYFAATAMQGCLVGTITDRGEDDVQDFELYEEIAKHSVRYADALLAQLEKDQK